MCGVYPVKNALTLGEEISSTYEGRHITMRDDELKHPTIGVGEDGFVDKGDPVIICKAANGAHGRAVGVAFNDGTASSDLIAVDTEGIWNLMVYADTDNAGTSAVVPGDALFIDAVTNQAGASGIGIGCLSKIRNTATQLPFGYALGNLDAGDEGRIAVKVHWDPMHDVIEGMHKTLATGEFGWSFYGHLEDGASEGVSGYVNGILDGAIGQTYNFGSWLNLLTGVRASAWLSPYEGGIYSDAGATTTNVAYAGYHHFVGDVSAQPSNVFCAWHLNVQGTFAACSCLIHATGPEAVAYDAAGTGTAVAGTIRVAINGSNLLNTFGRIRVYQDV